MFWTTIQSSAMAIPLQSLEARLGALRRRRRINFLRQIVSLIGPAMIGATLLLMLALLGAVARSG